MAKYVGTVKLYWKGKPYAGTSREVSAKSVAGARRVLKSKFSFKKGSTHNKVTVNKIKKVSK